ncbi:MAG: hypothetical protein JSW39_11085 [Desulfobacterales bacterium]|nr:MAG: hypothetical protein JSW39_11085 [Desulfobacterales bacterium]
MNRVKQAIIASAVGALEETAAGTVKRRYRFSPDFIGFSGHFPEYPILPAFIQILTALTLAEEQKGYALKLARITHAKFHIKLHPDQDIEVECQEQLVEGQAGCKARITTSEGLAASFAMSFAGEEHGA